MKFFEQIVNFITAPAKDKSVAGEWNGNHYSRFPDAIGIEVVGIEYRMNNLMKLASNIKKYTLPNKKIIEIGYVGRNIYQYYFRSELVQVVPEPTNPHDPNALMVIIDGQHVGYIPKNRCNEIKNYMQKTNCSISARISGGNYRIVYPNGTSANYSEPITITLVFRK